MVLDKIQKENDIKQLTEGELEKLRDEIREFLINSISVTGGHLASNLGVVELTMALHLSFDLPKDKIIWDVGHQSYTHKILTGRREGFGSLRQYGGMSGFPKASESDCDCFNTGHSSTSISAGLGMAQARELSGEDYHVVSVIGDGALTGGMAFEALNNASDIKSNFIIVLNDRGGANVGKNWTEEEKKKAKFEHEQELKIIQYKVIQNLIKESNNPKIADKYEVVVLNAKKALMGIQREKPQLYEASNIEFLDKRITQLIQSDNSIKALFMQPIGNLKECFNEIEKVITQTMSGNDSEDFSMRIHVMESKRDNIMQDLRILTQQAVYSHMEELTNSYVNGDIDIFESIANAVCVDVEDRYLAKINELLVYIDKNFSSINLYLDTMSNLSLGSINFQGKKVPLNFEDIEKNDNHEETTMTPEKKDFWDFFKSKKKKEEEKFARLEREAEIRNQQAQYRVQEQIRKKQEARQLASSDLDELLRLLNNIVSKGMNEKYNEILSQIQEVDCLNKQALENGKRQRGILKNLMEHLLIIENQLT